MYCCPISAFNWCPQGRAGRELGRSLLSTLLHTEKVKFITRCGNPLGGQRARKEVKGEWQLCLAEDASSNLGGGGYMGKGPEHECSAQFSVQERQSG